MSLLSDQLALVTQTIQKEISSLQQQITDHLKSGEAAAQEKLHALIESISAHFKALDVLHSHAVTTAQDTAAKIEADAKSAVGQAVGVVDQVAADVTEATQSL